MSTVAQYHSYVYNLYNCKLSADQTHIYSAENTTLGMSACNQRGTLLQPDSADITRGHCENLDQEDPLSAFREAFTLPDGVIYLDNNSLGPPPKATGPRMAQVMAPCLLLGAIVWLAGSPLVRVVLSRW